MKATHHPGQGAFMSSPTLQHSIEIRHGHLAGLLVLVAVLSAATTSFASSVHDSTTALTARPKVVVSSRAAYVANVAALTPEERAALYGNVSASRQRARWRQEGASAAGRR
jgi:hypothetical protein